MLSFDDLATMGRLGNQMFQHASLKGIALLHGYRVCIPPIDAAGCRDIKVRESDPKLYNVFELRDIEHRITGYLTHSESTLPFDTILFESCPDNTNLRGYFQNPRYFAHIAPYIRAEFSFCDEVRAKCHTLMPRSGNDVIAIHVRRGDYVNNPNRPLLPLEYYSQALTYFDRLLPVLVVSDDPDWCRAQELFWDDRFLITASNSSSIDLCLQSMCTYHIISNSTFSWWGAWLADSQHVIAPKLWLTGKHKDVDWSPLYLPHWRII